ncbi:hypothetical protein BDY17DRAFT_320078 [Neohortaea acidophila]|uniref:Uncharacterized protein n=1 Tax=Neohortaea acidophila TaxID=245834 RepID=A0A6A6Q5H3_9PEZI|nr:uncharacterized protein BDY17DRAFT_320078 [Neohortaea acidophila]KAF2487542.1 hypothetical protein BDY17DRAFT_320078 [Neohortaea acidophila]
MDAVRRGALVRRIESGPKGEWGPSGAQKGQNRRQELDAATSEGPSDLFERLFPDQKAETHGAGLKAPDLHADLPPLPLPKFALAPAARKARKRFKEYEETGMARGALRMRDDMANQLAETSVLVLNNASPNLVEDDFRRLIPQGRHIEGWTLEQGDILRIIPGRDLATLAPLDSYFLLFSSPLSAFTYQGHVARIHDIVASHSPADIFSPIPPPAGFRIHGIDAHTAIQNFTLVPPTQSLDLRKLKTPLNSKIQSLVQHGGYPALVKRPDRMPFEARLTLEGLPLTTNIIRLILLQTAKTRALGWSGSEDLTPQLSRWKPPSSFRGAYRDAAGKWHSESHRPAYEKPDDDSAQENDEQKQRTTSPVYIVGFHTSRALQSFVHYWHRRPMEDPGTPTYGLEEGDTPPIANVEVLW